MNIKRTLKLIMHEVFIQKKTIYSATLGVILFLMIFGKFDSIDVFSTLLYMGGLIITSHAFSDVHQKNRGYVYLTLPAKQSEKFFSRWFLTAIAYTAYVFFSYALPSQMMLMTSEAPIQLTVLFKPAVVNVILKYLILQSIVFLGAIYFKNRVLLKTGIALGIFITLFILFILAVSYIVCPKCIFISFVYLLENTFTNGFYYWGTLLAPVFIGIAYIRFKEYEI